MKCERCKAENAETAERCVFCGAGLRNPYSAPTSPMERPPNGPEGAADDTVATIIPYKNPGALIAYYLGLFSCTPVLGLPMAIIALVFAVKGFKAVRRNPSAHGTAHAVVGIVCGTIGLLINLLIVLAIVVALVASPRR